MTHTQARIAELEGLVDKLRLEAQAHAQEARTANSIIAEIYQVVTGATGEPGNWNGAKPVRTRIAELEAHIARSTEFFDYLSRPDLDKPQVLSLHLWLQCMEAVAAGRSLLAARAAIGGKS